MSHKKISVYCHEGLVRQSVFTPNGNWIISCGNDNRLQVGLVGVVVINSESLVLVWRKRNNAIKNTGEQLKCRGAQGAESGHLSNRYWSKDLSEGTH